MIMLPSEDGADAAAEEIPDLHGAVANFFGPDSPLRDAAELGGRPYEERPQQLAMATAVADSIADGEHLCVEAPTGVGKSFAYLIPAIYQAKACKKPVIISTHTIALQEQLVHRDIPLLRQLVDVPFSAALAKGRDNYICLQRLQNATTDHQQFLPSDDLVPEVFRLAEWAASTSDGTRSDLDFVPSRETWASVCSESGLCRNESSPNAPCFFRKARRRLYTADIIVTNHALFCTDMAIRWESRDSASLLPERCAVIVDEAHCFEDVAATHLGVRISSYGFRYVLNRLFNPRTNRGLLMRSYMHEAKEASLVARRAADAFFTRLSDWLDEQETPLTYRTPGHIPNLLAQPFLRLESELKKLAEDHVEDDALYPELKSMLARVTDARERLDAFLGMTMPDSVYWFERGGARQQNIVFNIVPIEVQPQLKRLLFDASPPVVLTSATLALNGHIGYFKERLGLSDARELILDSPFHYADQVDLYVPYSKMPSPSATESFVAALSEQIRFYIEKTDGKAFVLFTSYALMNRMAGELESFFVEKSIRLLVQGRDLQRTKMLECFREDIHSVIFGADSFWTGVDVPGESLSNVIIVKLPFAVPTHPLVAARKERMEAQGQNSFQSYFLPEAILRFRQGVGRLIRSASDSGILVILDPRVVSTSYGKYFLNAVPDCTRHIF